MLCLLFRGDGAGSVLLFGLDGVGRLVDTTDGERGDDVEGDWSSLLTMSPEDEERFSFKDGCSSLSVAAWDSHGRAAIHRSNQLQPHCGLLGSMNVGFPDFDGFLHICYFLCIQKRPFSSCSSFFFVL
ncbi:hypothetical protein HanXRQr2_Chr00c193g0834211 [Helianthus annuus]|uniref:Uncharacterized protein n=1 Tax=Helianthus annuus TaxID=4232 RepID=A0A9K3JYR1_HELAN|nr:hypothetical protein HanXRQr2_Chr00c193g0834211 [Helianthus annuus]